MANLSESLEVPYQSDVLEEARFSYSWLWFFRKIVEFILPLGSERTFPLANNQSVASNIDGMVFNKSGVSQAVVEFLIQRVTTGVSAVELIESGSFIVTYNPTAENWNISLTNINSPENSGVDFTITSSGQIQYTSTNITGTASISKVVWRARTMGAKNQLYSLAGAR